MYEAVVLTKTQAIWAAIAVVVIVILAWKFLKFAFKIGILVVAAVLLYLALHAAGII